MLNQSLESLDIDGELFVLITHECLNVLCNEGEWKNQTLKELKFNSFNIFVQEEMPRKELQEYIKCIRGFIKQNTPVNSFSFGNLENENFSEALMLNHNLLQMESENPFSKYFLERNLQYSEMKKRFKRKIMEVKTFDVSFQFQ
jgi:hypothetical protein